MLIITTNVRNLIVLASLYTASYYCRINTTYIVDWLESIAPPTDGGGIFSLGRQESRSRRGRYRDTEGQRSRCRRRQGEWEEVNGRGSSGLPSWLRGPGSIISSQQGPGQRSGRKRLWRIFSLKEHNLVATNLYVLCLWHVRKSSICLQFGSMAPPSPGYATGWAWDTTEAWAWDYNWGWKVTSVGYYFFHSGKHIRKSTMWQWRKP